MLIYFSIVPRCQKRNPNLPPEDDDEPSRKKPKVPVVMSAVFQPLMGILG